MRNLVRIRFVLAGWALASVFFTGVLLVGNIGDHKPPTFALYANAVHFAIWTLLLPFLSWCARWFPLEGQNRLRNGAALLMIVAVLAVPVMITQWAILFFTYFPYHSASLTFWSFLKSESGRFFTVDVLIGMVLVAALEGWRIWQSLQAERTRASELERQLAVSRLDALRMQLHPHFLFNTLHTIAGLIVEQPPAARRMVIALGELLRLTLEDTGSPLRSLAEELEFADLYLGIEKLRLGERLVIDYDIEPESTRAEVPQLLLQPLFENAVRHGAARITGLCEIRFRAYREGERLRLMISNDGPAHPGRRSLRGPEWASPTPKTGSACSTRMRSPFNTRSGHKAELRSRSPFHIRTPRRRGPTKPRQLCRRNTSEPQNSVQRLWRYRLTSV